jgi:hypothetical protein
MNLSWISTLVCLTIGIYTSKSFWVKNFNDVMAPESEGLEGWGEEGRKEISKYRKGNCILI